MHFLAAVITSLVALTAAAPTPDPAPQTSGAGSACGLSNGRYLAPNRVTFMVACGYSAWAKDLPVTGPVKQATFAGCINQCAANVHCLAVHYQTDQDLCYLMNHNPDIVAVQGAGVPQDANIALRTYVISKLIVDTEANKVL